MERKENLHRAEIWLADWVRLLCVNVVSGTLLNLLLWVHQDHKMWNMKAWGMPQWPNSSWALEYDVLRWTTEKKLIQGPWRSSRIHFVPVFVIFPLWCTIFAFSRPRTRPQSGFKDMASKPIYFWRNWHHVEWNSSNNELLSQVCSGNFVGFWPQAFMCRKVSTGEGPKPKAERIFEGFFHECVLK